MSWHKDEFIVSPSGEQVSKPSKWGQLEEYWAERAQEVAPAVEPVKPVTTKEQAVLPVGKVCFASPYLEAGETAFQKEWKSQGISLGSRCAKAWSRLSGEERAVYIALEA